jgi:hypothetical protein
LALSPEGEQLLRLVRSEARAALAEARAAEQDAELSELRSRSRDFRLDDVERALEALPVSAAVRSNARVVLDAAVRVGLRPSRVSKYEDGVAFFFLPSAQTGHPGRRAYASISVTEDATLVGLTSNGAQQLVSWEYSFSEAALDDAVGRVLKFFVG